MFFWSIFVFTLSISFVNVYAGPSGLVMTQIANTGPLSQYGRGRSPHIIDEADALLGKLLDFSDMPLSLLQLVFWEYGMVGVAVIDYDNDGDQDLYITNAKGTANSLFQNQFAQTGSMDFIDVAVSAGVAATNFETSGVCYGDTDNDGDVDLLVLNRFSGRQLFFENNGDGTFTDKSATANIVIVETIDISTVSCTLGDVTGDGLHDIFIGNSFDINHPIDCFMPAFQNPDPAHGDGALNSLFINQGNNVWTEESQARGISTQGITWAVAAVDHDKDGDIDLWAGDDNCAIPSGPFPRGYIRIYENDGTGNFTDVSQTITPFEASSYMGFSFADFNGDDKLDFFVTNFGAYTTQLTTGDDKPSRWFLQTPSKTFVPHTVNATVFGWGTSAFDFNNNGKTDVLYHGGMDMSVFWDGSNAGAALINDGNANFLRDSDILAGTDHQRRTVHGSAMGDLNNDGFPDMISVSSFDWPSFLPMVPFPNPVLGSEFDTNPMPGFTPGVEIFPNGTGVLLNFPRSPGSLSVEINSGNQNGWISVLPRGSAGIVTGAKTPRDGIGSIVSVTPHGGQSQSLPAIGGSSHLSQDAIEKNFGLGDAFVADVEIFWPGGVTNFKNNAIAFSRYTFHEIPCDVKGTWNSFNDFVACVQSALGELENAQLIQAGERGPILSGNIHGYRKYHPGQV